SDDVDRKRRLAADGGAVTEPPVRISRRTELRPAQVVLDPRPKRSGALDYLVAPAGVGATGRRLSGHPFRRFIRIPREDLAHRLPRVLLHLALNVMVAGHDEQPLSPDAGSGEDRIHARRRVRILLFEPPVSHVAGEADQIDAAACAEL